LTGVANILRLAIVAAATLTVPAWPVVAADESPPPAASPLNPPCAIWSAKDWSPSGVLLGDVDGIRTAFGNDGINLGLQETSEILGNVSAGVHRGAEYDGLTTMCMTVDLSKMFGEDGGFVNISALQIHGRAFSADMLRTLQTASDIEADRTTRLWELWYQRPLLGGMADVRIGQQSLDQEFMISQYSALFLNAAMGWPALPSLDLYAGGPAYPLSSLGMRFTLRPTPALTLLGGVFDDNPSGGPFDSDSQLRDGEASGTRFNLNTGALFIVELQYAINQPADDKSGQPAKPSGLPGTYKLGGWFDTASFPDQRFDNSGLSLADPASSGVPRMHSGDFSLYAIADQAVWLPDPSGKESVGVFLRLFAAPADRNLSDFGMNAGISVKAPFGDERGAFGIGYGLAQIGGRASALDRDTAMFTGTGIPVRSSESFVEVTYQYQVTPWWLVQPDFQYVFNPGAGISNPDNPTQRIGNETVFGVQTKISF